MKRRAFLGLAALLPWLRPKVEPTVELPPVEVLDQWAMESPREWLEDKSWAYQSFEIDMGGARERVYVNGVLVQTTELA